MAHANDAKRSRPYAPDYGFDDKGDEGMLTWAWISEQMEKSRNYWICSTRPDGNPHAAPVWGVWMYDRVYFGTGTTSRKAKNFAHNPHVVLHLESGDDTVIFEGVIERVDSADVLKPILEAYKDKYPPYDPTTTDASEAQGAAYYTVNPTRVLAWLESDYPNTATRWNLA